MARKTGVADRKKEPEGESLRKELAEKESRIHELEDRIRYMQADFDNYRKHLNKQACELEKNANERLIVDMLEILDDLEQALEKSGPEREGLRMLFTKLMDVLKKHGLKPIESRGRDFDPYYHEAMMMEKSSREKGKVLEEFQKGYMLNSRVIRHTKAKVSGS
jgi:molecular chaperone GrpE